MPRQERQQPVVVETLADFHRAYRLHATCRQCEHHDWVDLPALGARYGWDALWRALSPKLRCSGCQGKQVAVTLHHNYGT